VPHKPIMASVSEHQTVFLNRDQVAGQEVTLRSATRKAAIGSGQGFARCACKTVFQSDAFARNKEMYAPQNATKVCLVACVVVRCSVLK
jgi:ATP-dependent protease HslVU (ClpYQ) peptidase subunit